MSGQFKTTLAFWEKVKTKSRVEILSAMLAKARNGIDVGKRRGQTGAIVWLTACSAGDVDPCAFLASVDVRDNLVKDGFKSRLITKPAIFDKCEGVMFGVSIDNIRRIKAKKKSK